MSGGEPPRPSGAELASAEARARAEVRAAGLDETCDGAAWQAVYYAALRRALDGPDRTVPARGTFGKGPAPEAR